jgi:hypothetical protein
MAGCETKESINYHTDAPQLMKLYAVTNTEKAMKAGISSITIVGTNAMADSEAILG